MRKLNFDKMEGHVIAVIQDVRTSEVINTRLMSEKSLHLSLASKSVILSSRGRDQYWTNGLILSGFSETVRILVDCDRDCLLFQVEPRSSTCTGHFGSLSCFHSAVDQLDFAKLGGLVISVIQHAKNHKVLMVETMNQEALGRTLTSGNVTLWSRSRRRIWTKGKTSGNTLKFEDGLVNCDRNTILCQVTPAGPACHTGAQSCFEERNGTGRDLLRL